MIEFQGVITDVSSIIEGTKKDGSTYRYIIYMIKQDTAMQYADSIAFKVWNDKIDSYSFKLYDRVIVSLKSSAFHSADKTKWYNDFSLIRAEWNQTTATPPRQQSQPKEELPF